MIIRHTALDRRALANAARDAEILAGFTWKTEVFQVDPESRSAIAARAMKVFRTGEDVVWQSLANTGCLFSAQEFLEFSDGVEDFIEGVRQKCWQVKCAPQ